MIPLVDKLRPMKGGFALKVYKRGRLIEEFAERNLIVNGAYEQVARLIAGDAAGRSISHIAFGTNGTEPTDADDIITNPYLVPISGYEFPDVGKVQFNWGLSVTENNGMAILEFGLLTADGTLFARRTRTNPIHKEADISIEGHWTIEI